jgi:hypothetical protein
MVAERRIARPASARCLGRRTSNKSERKRPRLPGILSAEDLTEVSRVTRRFRKGIAVVACRKERTDAVKTSPQRRKPFPPLTLYTRGEPVNAVVARYPDCVPEPKRGSFRHCKLLHYSTAEKSKQNALGLIVSLRQSEIRQGSAHRRWRPFVPGQNDLHEALPWLGGRLIFSRISVVTNSTTAALGRSLGTLQQRRLRPLLWYRA